LALLHLSFSPYRGILDSSTSSGSIVTVICPSSQAREEGGPIGMRRDWLQAQVGSDPHEVDNIGPSTPKSDSLLDFAFSGCRFLGLVGRIRKVRYLYLMKEAAAAGLLRREDRDRTARR
jgi:hypothetical protein